MGYMGGVNSRQIKTHTHPDWVEIKEQQWVTKKQEQEMELVEK